MAVFLMSTKTAQTKWTLASFALRDAYTDFVLSRQAMQCTPATLEFYKHTAGKFLEWLETQGVTSPQELTARYVRQYLAELTNSGKRIQPYMHMREQFERSSSFGTMRTISPH